MHYSIKKGTSFTINKKEGIIIPLDETIYETFELPWRLSDIDKQKLKFSYGM